MHACAILIKVLFFRPLYDWFSPEQIFTEMFLGGSKKVIAEKEERPEVGHPLDERIW